MGNGDLLEDAEYFGEWFLPGSDERVAGTLHYSNGQLRLFSLRPIGGSVRGHDVVRGNCVKLSKTRPQRDGSAPRTVLSAAGPVTLLGDRSGFFPNYLPRAAIFGELPDDQKLRGISFSFDTLHEWAMPREPYQDNGSADFAGLEKPELLEFGDGEADCTLCIVHRIQINAYEGRHDSHESYFKITPKSGMRLQDLGVNYVQSIQSFLRIAMGRNINLVSINRTDGKREPILVPVPRKPDKFSELEHLAHLEDMREDFGGIMGRWLRFYANNRYAVDLFLKTTDTTYVEMLDFFAYASLLEGYAKYKYESSPEFEYESCDSRGQKGDSMYKKRIGKVLEPFRDDFGNMDEFVDNVHKMRNDLFHANRMETVDADLRDRITHDLYFLIRIILLNETGLNLSVDSSQYRLNFAFLELKKPAVAD